ncbi:hypothetical protein [Rhodanobacter denitrificans]|uniref:hypothetical protein n=1 Tax=Rhodanobacter denitrificans TaxID=666685 RepID=UPI001F1ECFEF|nr:hypothetical protein [Rhodanobacter denitrificans]UJJ58237.1 hypothetical protein LRK55_16515 [Rhodanobacter denitrificans]
MANASVTTATGKASAKTGSKHDLWITGGDKVLTVTIDKQCKEFPPETEHCRHLNNTIQGLARAAKAVVFHAENDSDASFAMQPIEDIADAIILLSQLSDAIRSEVGGVQS